MYKLFVGFAKEWRMIYERVAKACERAAREKTSGTRARWRAQQRAVTTWTTWVLLASCSGYSCM